MDLAPKKRASSLEALALNLNKKEKSLSAFPVAATEDFHLALFRECGPLQGHAYIVTLGVGLAQITSTVPVLPNFTQPVIRGTVSPYNRIV
jgi:hypothetical protein